MRRFSAQVAWAAAAILLAGVSTQAAQAHSYQGPRSEVACWGMICEMQDVQFASVQLRGEWAGDPAQPVFSLMPFQPTERGGAALRNVSFYFSREDGPRLLLTVEREYETDGRRYTISYPVTDPLAGNVQQSGAVPLDLTIYMSADQTWIESREGFGDLARVWTAPLFFGFGPTADSNVRIELPGIRNYSTAFYRVDSRLLIDDLNSNYAKLPDATPFLYRGNVAGATALAAILEGSRQ